MKAPNLRIQIIFLYLFLSYLFADVASAQVADAGKATTGSGLYKDRIFWLNWDLNKDGAGGDLITNGSSRTFTSPAGVLYQATISNVTGTPKSSNSYDYSGNNFPSGYGNIGGNTGAGNIVGINNGCNACTSTFRITITANYPNGISGNVAAFVIGGTETLASTSEFYQITVPSGTVRYLDKYIKNDNWTNSSIRLDVSNAGRTIKVTNPGTGDSRGDALLIAEDVPYIDAQVKGGGGQHFGIGFIEDLDYSDAPNSYGKATHIVNNSIQGGTFTSPSLNTLSTTTNVSDTQKGSFVSPNLILGTNIDVESNYNPVTNGTTPNTDDITGIDDEDGIQDINWSTCTGTVFVKNTTASLAYLNLWIDANSNGIFDNNENTNVTIPSGTNGNINVPLNPISGLTSGNSYYARLRLSTTQNLPPSGFAADGEAEDHWVNITKTTLTTNPLTSCVGSPIIFTSISGMLNYNWTGPNGFTSNQQNPIIANSNTSHNGVYTLVVTTPGGCTISDSTNVIVNPLPTAPIISSITQPSCNVSTGSVSFNNLPSSGTWTVTASPSGTSITGSGTNAIFNGLTGNNTYTFTVTNSNGCTSAVSAQVLINAQPATPNAPLAGAVTHPTCATATGSFQIMGYNSNSVYNFNPAVLNISATGVVTANAGTYTFTETNAAGCTSAVSAQVLINAQPATPNAPLAGAVTHPTCATATGSFQIMGYNSNSVYNFNPAVLNISATGVVTANAGTYTFTETNAAGCTSAVSAQVLINAQPATPNAPLAGAVTHPTCATATGSFQIMGYNSNSVYNFNPAVLNISATGVVTANAGTYTFTETNAAGCTSAVSAQVLINAQPATPNAPLAGAVTQPTCATATGSFQIMGYNSNSVYNFNPAVLNISATGVVTANAGTYTFTETNAAGCTSAVSAQVLINAQPATPNAPLAGAVTHPTCATATGSFQIMGYNSNSVYNFNPAILNISATGVVTANAGTYTFTETNAAGCTSAVSAQVLINAQPATPNAPLAGAVTHPTCATATGSFQIMGYNSNSVYNFNPAILNISATGVVTANAGTYTFTETNAAGCTSAVSAQVLINAQPATPNAPLAGAVTHPTCATATGSFQIIGYNSNSVYNFNPAVLNISATGVVTANAGTYTFTETNAAGCTSAVSAQVLINAQPATPNAPLAGAVTHPTCATATGSFQIMGYNSNSVYNFNPAVLNISATGVVTANAGTYTFTETNAAGCTSAVSAQVLINAQPATPNAPLAGAVTHPTCATATGSFQIIGYNSNSVYNFNPAVLNISATGVVTANAGTYTFTETNAAGCTSAVSAQVLINAQPATPNAPLAGAVTHPTCATATGSFQIIGYNSNSVYNFNPAVLNISATGVVTANAGTYTFTETNAAGCTSAVSAQVLINAQPATPTPPTATTLQPTCTLSTGTITFTTQTDVEYSINNGTSYQASNVFSGLNPATYTLRVRSTTDNTCTAQAATTITINTQPVTPSAPITGAITQPNCITSTGSVILNGLPTSDPWTIITSPSGLTLNGFGTSVNFTGLNPGNTYTFTVTNSNGCTSPPSSAITVYNQICAVNETTAPINGLSGGTTAPLTANDTLNGALVTVGTAPGNVQITASTVPVGSGLIVNPNGTVSVPANTPAGTYTVNYTICEVNNPKNCSNVNSIVVVDTPQIITVTETTAPINGLSGGTTAPLTANDTLNGALVTVGTAPGNVQITASTVPVGSGLIVNPNGTVSVPANTPAGTYTVNYTICEVNNPKNCSNVNSIVVVDTPQIIAVTETTTPINGLSGGTTAPLTANDTLNGALVTVGTAPGNVQITASTVPVGSGLIVNPNGTVSVPANTPAGTYTVNYTICEVNNPKNCSNVNSIVVVDTPQIITVTETTAPINGLSGGTTAPLTANDTLNGALVTVGTAPGNVQITASTVPVGSGLIVNPNGTVSVPANTPAGTYTVNYTICEVNNPKNCSNVNSIVVVDTPQIIAVTETTAPINGLSGGTTAPLTANDTLNGALVTVGTAPGNVQITASTVPVGSGLIVNPNGTVSVPANTPAGTYTVNYTICEVNNPKNCSNVNSIVVVDTPQIIAVTETTTPINGLSGGTTAPLTANDTLNGALVTVGTAPGNVQITASTVPVGSGLIVNPNGTVSVPANTPAGTYTVNYTICEVNNPKNCSNVNSIVVVDTPQIITVTETTAPINGLSGGTTAPLTANDTLNGALVTVGTAPGNVQITASTVPVGSGLIVNPNGTVSVPANTPAGTYTVNYTICEVNNPKNCSNVNSIVVVDTPQIIAVTETTAPINGLSGGTTAPLTANDTLNGALVTVGTAPGNVQITASTVPVGSGLIVNPNGTVSVPANTPAGTYTVNYTICEVNNPKNCSNVNSIVVVDTPQIIAVTETTAPINGLSGGTTAPLTANDTLNGALVTVGTAPGNVQITASTVPVGSGLIVNPNGTVSVPANTPAGTYTVNYTICEVNNPKNCSNVNSIVVVDTPQIIAVTETTTPINGLSGGTTAPLTANDTLNGALVTVGTAPGNVQITASTVPVGSGLIVNPNGTVSVPANTPAGTYTVNYTICEVNNPKNCSNVNSIVVVDTPQIIAVTETTAPINGLSGGTTAPLTANDTLNGALVTVGTAPGNVQITASTVPVGSGLIVNPNGTVSVPANTPAGTYTVNYTICEVNNPKNCSNVNSIVVVDTPQIIAVTETTAPINGLSGGTTAPLTANDTLNGALVTVGTAPGNVQITASTVPVGSGLIVNPNGTVSVPANTPAGTYTVNYTICEVNNPKNCSNVNSIVVVDTPQIIAVTETTAPINGLSGGTTAPLTANDTLNGALVTVGTAPGNVQITASTVPVGSGLIVNPNGTVSVPANTPAGTYTVNYTICEVNNPKNCSNVNSIVVVDTPQIITVTETTAPINGLSGGTTAPLTANDTLNGALVTVGTAPGNVQITASTVPVGSGLIVNPNGTVSVPANTPAGTYTVNYTICEVNNPKNCSNVNSIVVVDTPQIIAVTETTAPINGLSGGTTAPLTANDTLNGALVTVGTAPGNVQITASTVPVGSGLIVNPNGTVSVPANTPAGTYTVNYTICEVNNPKNCSNVNSIVVVDTPQIIAVTETTAPINGLSGGTTAPLTANDTLNGALVTVGTAPGNVQITASTVPVGSGLIVNPNGTVSVPANTPAGTYTVNYTICEVNNPKNCSNVNSIVVVDTPQIIAVTETTAPINGLSGGTTAPLTANDTLNGALVTVGTAPGNVQITASTVPVGSGLIVNPNGTVSVPANTPAGTYTVNYTICEVNNPKNCSNVNSIVVVDTPQIIAVTETTAPINGLSGGTTAPLTANDTLNGALVTVGTAPGNVQITASTVPVGSGLIVNPNGTVSVPANTPAGTYTVNYTICEVNNPKNCSNVNSIVVVDTPQIITVTETTAPINGLSGGTTAPLTANDTLNGALVTVGTAPGNVQITASTVPVGSGLIVNPNGTVSVPANTPAGTYTVNYTICEVNNPKNCSNVNSIVVVDTPQIIAVTETTAPINGLSGGTTAPLTANDTLNGALVTVGTAPGNVQITASTVPVGSGLIVNPNGTVSVPANTPAGTYTVNYTICEVNNPKNCSNVNSIVVVDTPQIIAVTETTAPINGLSGGTTAPLTANDTLNGALVTVGTAPGNVQITASTVPVGSGLIVNPNGTVSVPANTPAGTYTVNYTICEVNNPKNCSNVNSIVVVSEPTVNAQNDTFSSQKGSQGETLGNIFTDNGNGSDLADGNQANLNNITLTTTAWTGQKNPYIDLNGNVIVPSGTPSGTYTIPYKICLLTPFNTICDTATVTVTVHPSNNEEVVVYNHMTPNGDGDNDVFFIDGVDKFPNNSVEVYNRWGVLVYEAKGYNNNDRAFRGISSGRVTIKQLEELPEGTYYYMFKYENTSGVTKEKAGYLYINR
ncbi:gliding motility-associated C-terminal domain-containing protein [Flavobacterium columnare]|uniref:T9SS type B sorting domain-containing protein n=4 Tax=Flavobacterium TaxID=237 RepID=UPI0017851269|nr:gliding motility-associated C-terminal domain-containing protein [Flavobacterium columnare]QOG89555.1 gliding motility-associated C-terminal domain-containing protein [Flavobacterium columnare]QOG92214.1 gliding motility-associated C-terminal domain-containing protein [Flavobacterium columnare]QOG94878.1 gliding motility-associated C-terminal domain-containing protein [Flavobacterium columnare]QOG97538.1 gliding motility-associated C-terminal domain-containing protein [Flavobacterium columna